MRLHVKTKLRKEIIHLILLKEVKTIEVVIEVEEEEEDIEITSKRTMRVDKTPSTETMAMKVKD